MLFLRVEIFRATNDDLLPFCFIVEEDMLAVFGDGPTRITLKAFLVVPHIRLIRFRGVQAAFPRSDCTFNLTGSSITEQNRRMTQRYVQPTQQRLELQ